MEYYFADGDVQRGPFAPADLARQGVGPDTLVWREGLSDWRPARDVPELAFLFVKPSPLEPTPPAPPNPPAAFVPEPLPAPPPVPLSMPAPPPLLQYGGYAPAVRANAPLPNGMAIASLILGILSLPASAVMTCLCFVTSPLPIVAVVLGHLAYRKARRGEAGGAGMALAGMICGYVVIGLMLAWGAFLAISSVM